MRSGALPVPDLPSPPHLRYPNLTGAQTANLATRYPTHRKQRGSYFPISVARVHFSSVSPAYACAAPMPTATPIPIAHSDFRFMFAPSAKSVGLEMPADPDRTCSIDRALRGAA